MEVNSSYLFPSCPNTPGHCAYCCNTSGSGGHSPHMPSNVEVLGKSASPDRDDDSILEKSTILQVIEEFEEREAGRWAAAEERLRQHEVRMETWASELFELLEKRALINVVSNNELAEEVEGVRDSDVTSENPTALPSSGYVDQSNGTKEGDNAEEAALEVMQGINDQELPVGSSNPEQEAARSKKHVFGWSQTGALRKHAKLRTVGHAKAHLQNLRQARAIKIRQQSSRIVNSRLAQEKKTFDKKKHSTLHRMVKSPRFDGFFGLMILINAVFTGFETDYESKRLGVTVPFEYDLVNLMFCMIFFVELVLRIMGFKYMFFYGKDWSWNMFDLLVVLSSVVSELATWTAQNESRLNRNFTAVRVLRLLRLVRMTRVVRSLRGLHVLRVMVLSILGSFRPLLWTCVLLGTLLFVNGVYITQVVSDYRADPNNIGWIWELEHYYGSVTLTVYSLFRSISGGVDWGDVAEPLGAITPWFLPYFCFLVALVVFTFLNVVTGIFVDHALKTAESDRDIIIREEMARRHAYGAEVEVVFREADSNGDGLLSYDELANHFEDEAVGAWLGTLGIDSASGHTLFELLDEDGQGFVDITEFVQGCFRLKGYARSIDLAMMQFEQRKLMHDLRRLQKLTLKNIFGMCEILQERGTSRAQQDRSVINHL